MKRDMELVRKILIKLEYESKPIELIPPHIDGYSEEQVSYHYKLLTENGIIEAIDCTTDDGFEWQARGLTWQGHDYIDAIRDENRWQTVKDWIKSSGKVLTIETLKQAIKELFF
ncbi:MAG: DUF2513 domain-containing protein [Candidatus Woesearchaeota archaeon]